MQFSEFRNELLIGINKKDLNVISLIDSNEKLVKEYFNENNLNYVRNFVEDLYLPILNEKPILSDKKAFKTIENVLKHPLMNVVLNEFRNSNTLIKLCEEGSNDKAVEWLLSNMDMNLTVQDENGKTALMHAVNYIKFEKVIDKFLKIKGKHLDLTDNEGNTALFHASLCFISIFEKFLKSNLFDYNHVNKNDENVLLFCAKNGKIKLLDFFLNKSDFDFNHCNKEGKNLAMILAEHGNYSELKTLVKKKNIDVNYQNEFGETIVSFYIKGYYQQIKGELGKDYNTDYHNVVIRSYAETLKVLVKIGCDFNCTIDGDGNTPAMFYMIMEDYVSLKYILDNCEIDLSKKNKYGVDAIILSLSMKENIFNKIAGNRALFNKLCISNFSFNTFKHALLSNEGFNFNDLDSSNNNLVILGLIHNDPYIMNIIDRISPKILFEKNNRNENAIIVATKLGNYKILKSILGKVPNEKEKEIKINSKDHLGNTALHYAVLMKDSYAINLLMNHKADPNIKNNNELTAIDLSKDIEESNISDLLIHPIPILEMETQMGKDKSIDKKTDDYIKNYRINDYQQEYNNLIKNNMISYYIPSPSNIAYQQWIVETLYSNKGKYVYEYVERMVKLEQF